MRKRYQLIRLKSETVKDMKTLAAKMGKGSLDDLIVMMMKLTEENRHELGSNWRNGPEG